MSEEKQYCGNAKEINTKHGTMTKISLTADDLKVMEKNLSNGWVNINLCDRREPSKGGMTKYMIIDTWSPEKKTDAPAAKVEAPESPDLPFN